MDLKIKGKTVIITGSGNGLGRAIALGLAAEGAKVVVADLKKQDAEKVSAEIKTAGNESLAVSCDATNPDDVEQMVQKTLEAYGDIDILVNNVGGGFDTGFVVKTSIDIWDKTIELNLKSAFLCCRAVAPVMMKNKKGRIINISSVSGRQGEPLLGPYCAAKFGIAGFTQVLAKELARFEITVNAVCPGYVYTPGWEKLAQLLKDAYPSHAAKSLEEIFAERVKSVTPLGRPQTAEEIASLVAYLASEEARSITGQSISIDGGIFMN
ncbi:MAG TPA: SDR family NAD(P)-dependent oxidoreductase [Smithellaceae bacterium]|nr:SDR family NAD(P)-dependent oxidoreductase [Smithellaceae bacterium]HRS89795.1 SDR family NAD(P)-dependent oxidoreductase [Smithellaceae bacterium]HRV25127.1 SDR family NAD(P)-dependent oxidoreductase [Smithellaceae bacterium]